VGLSGPFADAAASLDLSDDLAPDPMDTPSTSPTDSLPAATDPPAVPEPPPEAEARPPADDAEGFKLDALGRLHRPDGTVASKAEAEDYKARHPDVPAVTEPVTTSEPARVEPTPYVFMGHDAPLIDGALIHPTTGDIFIPAAQRDALERDIMRGRKYEQFRDDRRTAIQRADTAEQRGDARVSALVNALPFLHNREAFYEFLGQAAQNDDAASLAFDRLDLALDKALDAVDRKFGPSAAPAPVATRGEGNDTPAGAPLDRDDATEAFTDYYREQLSRPEFKGMPAELQQDVRAALADLQLFVRDADGDWCINGRAAEPVWAMARRAMTAATTALKAKDFNAGQAARASATSAVPPSVSAGKPRVGAPASSGSASVQDPMIDPKTGQPYTDPWDAIRKAKMA